MGRVNITGSSKVDAVYRVLARMHSATKRSSLLPAMSAAVSGEISAIASAGSLPGFTVH